MDRLTKLRPAPRHDAASLATDPAAEIDEPPEGRAQIDEPPERRAEFESTSRDLRHGDDVATELLAAENVGRVLAVAVERARRLLRSDIAFVMLLDDAGKMLRLEASVGHRTPTFTTIVRPVQAITAVGSGRPVQSADFLNDSQLDHDPQTDDIVRKEGMRNVLGIPLRLRESDLGALYVGNRYVRQFTPDDVNAMLQLADNVAAALAKAQDKASLSSRLDQVVRRADMLETELQDVVRAERVLDKITASLRGRAGVAGFAVAVAEGLDRSVVVTDWKLAVIAQAQSVTMPVEETLSRPPFDRRELNDLIVACAETHRPIRLGNSWAGAPIEVGSDLFGYVWVSRGGEQGQGQLVDMVLRRLGPIAALESLREGDTRRRLHGDFIYELLSERLPDYRVLDARAAQVWPRHLQPHRPVIFNVIAEGVKWSDRLEAARRILTAARPQDFVAVYGKHLVLLIGPPGRDEAAATVSDVIELLKRNGLVAIAAVGGVCSSLPESRQNILATLRLQQLLEPRSTLWTEGLEALAQLFDPGERTRLESFCRTALTPFQGRLGLLDALHAYYQAGGNRALAAQRLGVHVNTVRHRLERVEELAGGSIDESIRAVPLRLALLVREVIGTG